MKISKNLKTWGVFKDKEIEKSWEDKNWTIFTNYDFAPTKAKTEIMTGYKILMTIYSDSNKLKVENEKVTDKLIYTAKVENLQKGDTIWVPYLYYPYYELKIIDGENEILKQRPTESKDGMIQFKINEKISREAKLEIYYKPTAIVIVSYYGALLSTIALIVYIIIFKFKMKKFNTQ